MYNLRINKWGLNKHYKAGEKEILATQIAEAYLQNLKAPEITFRGRPVKMHRIIRHCKVMAKRKSSNTRLGTDSLSPSPQSDQSSGNSSGMLTPTTNSTPQSSNYLSPQPDDITDGTQNVSPDQSLAIRLRISSPPPQISLPTDRTNIEAILLSIRAYYQWHFDTSTTRDLGPETSILHSVSQREPLGVKPLPDSQILNSAFWNKIKSAIYFLKVKSPLSAWPLLDQACGMASEVVTQHPVAFLREIFATISPTNTTVCPGVRKHLLQFLAAMVQIKLGPSHPFSIICHNLQMDAGCRKTSETALQCMIDIFQEHQRPNHLEVFLLKRSLITLWRREAANACRTGLVPASKCQNDMAEASAIALVNSAETHFGSTDKRTRLAMSELAHIYTDQERYVEAEDLCTDALLRGSRGLGDNYPDDRCIYVIEDLAQLCGHRGDHGQEIAWLYDALQGAIDVFGKDAATLHILEKLENCLEAAGRFAEVRVVRQKFAEL
jgi:hypothetical protein